MLAFFNVWLLYQELQYGRHRTGHGTEQAQVALVVQHVLTALRLGCTLPLVREVFIVHVGGTRCVTSRTDNIMKIRARITLTVECIRGCIFIFLLYVSIQGRVRSRLTFLSDFTFRYQVLLQHPPSGFFAERLMMGDDSPNRSPSSRRGNHQYGTPTR